jgi:hypothetical protein
MERVSIAVATSCLLCCTPPAARPSAEPAPTVATEPAPPAASTSAGAPEPAPLSFTPPPRVTPTSAPQITDRAITATVLDQYETTIRLFRVEGAILVAELEGGQRPAEEEEPTPEEMEARIEAMLAAGEYTLETDEADEGPSASDPANRVAVLEGDKLRWFAQLPQPEKGWSRTDVIAGRYPDRLDATYTYVEGPSLLSHVHALTGKGEQRHSSMSGGGGGGFVGFADLGLSRIALDTSNWDHAFVAVRGPAIERKTQRRRDHCGDPPDSTRKDEAALPGSSFGASSNGTLVTIGLLCGETPAAEVGLPDGTSSIVRLDDRLTNEEYYTGELHSHGDELWFVARSNRVLRLAGHDFEVVAAPGGSMLFGVEAVVGPRGRLHVAHQAGISRLEGKTWRSVLRFDQAPNFSSFVVRDDGSILVVAGSTQLLRLEQTTR